MDHKGIIITGGAQGIGKAAAHLFVRSGYAVTLADIDAEAGRETEAELASLGPVAFIHTDVADEQAVAGMMTESLARFGRVDVLINNAGVNFRSPVTELDLDLWNRLIDVNLTGPFLCARQAAPHLIETGGSIVNIASTRALMSEPDSEAYAASKGGLVALTHALALSLGPKVRVNCISPGWIDVSVWKKMSERHRPQLSDADHAQHPAGRVGRAEDVAALALYLTSEAAGFITGQNFVVDGGMTKKMIYC